MHYKFMSTRALWDELAYLRDNRADMLDWYAVLLARGGELPLHHPDHLRQKIIDTLRGRTRRTGRPRSPYPVA